MIGLMDNMKLQKLMNSINSKDNIIIVDNSTDVISINESGVYHYIYSYNNKEPKRQNFIISNNLDVIFNEYHLTDKNEITTQFLINIEIGCNSRVNYNVINHSLAILSNKLININVDKDSYLKTYISELGNESSSEYNINLNNEGSSVDFNLMIYGDKSINQKHNVNINHMSKNTHSTMTNHGVIDDYSNCEFDVKSFIKKGASKSTAYQSSKILMLSDVCTNKLNPQLLIDEYDVSGGHAAICGKISENEMYYMASRGLSKEATNKLIAIGNLITNAPYSLTEILIKRIEERLSNE